LRLAGDHEISTTLPESLTFSGDADLAYNVWSILEAVQWRWTIREVLDQPESLLNDVVMIASMNARMRKAERENANK
jgi:hypothetical protein